MEQSWYSQLDEIGNELRAMDTITPEGPVLIDALLRLISVLHSFPVPQSPQQPGARRPGAGKG